MNRLRFVSLASGSSGNCYFIGTGTFGILVDAGIGPRTIKKRLKEVGIPFEHIQAVFITHDHIDHIKAVGSLGEKYFLPIYSTEKVHQGIHKCYGLTEKLYASKKHIEKGETIQIKDFTIEAFSVSHDSTDSVGYTIHYNGKRFTIATDLGYICEHAASHIKKANYLILEANYDEHMLMTGRYPAHLKARVNSKTGHMNNKHTAAFLADNYHDGLDYIYLCHLSKDNNSPEIAHAEVNNQLSFQGIKVGEEVQLYALERTTPSELYIYE